MRQVERHLSPGGTRVLVRDVGSGRPVLLVNGIGAHVEMWRPLERVLRDMRVVSFDAPGTGRSATPLLPYSMSGLARLIEKLLDELELENTDVVGYSFGGALAQQFALRFPERVRRLVLAATGPGWGAVPGDFKALVSIGTPFRYYSRTFYQRTAGTVAGGRTRHDPHYVERLWRDRAGHAPSFAGYTQQIWALTTWSSLPWLSRIQAPTLVVVGDDDPLVPLSNALMMAARIPRARLFVGRGEGHFQLLDDQTSAVLAIREFLTAGELDDAEVWRTAPRVEEAEVASQLRSDGLGALPWGAVSALFRQVVGTPASS
jgi:poly(3-hydroxyalkanoate) depolymerase